MTGSNLLTDILVGFTKDHPIHTQQCCINVYWMRKLGFIKDESTKEHTLKINTKRRELLSVLIPDKFEHNYEAQPIFVSGNVLFISSLLNDWYHDKPMLDNLAMQRAYSLEADYYWSLGIDVDDDSWNNYQYALMKNHPNGRQSIPPEAHYTYRPVSLNGWSLEERI